LPFAVRKSTDSAESTNLTASVFDLAFNAVCGVVSCLTHLLALDALTESAFGDAGGAVSADAVALLSGADAATVPGGGIGAGVRESFTEQPMQNSAAAKTAKFVRSLSDSGAGKL